MKTNIIILLLVSIFSSLNAIGNKEIGLDTNYLSAQDINNLVNQKISESLKVNDFTYDKILKANHEFLGYVILGTLATQIYLGSNQKDMQNFSRVHQTLGEFLALSMVVSSSASVYGHREDLFDFSEGITKEHIHATLGGIATYLIVSNALTPNKDSHKNNAMIGGSLAIIGYTFTLF